MKRKENHNDMAHNINPQCWLYRFGPRHYSWYRGGPPRNTFEKFPGLPLLGPGFRLQQDRFKTAVDDPEECRGRGTQRKPGSETHVVLPCFCQFLFFHEQKKNVLIEYQITLSANLSHSALTRSA